jgi:hypothetical protein
MSNEQFNVMLRTLEGASLIGVADQANIALCLLVLIITDEALALTALVQ